MYCVAEATAGTLMLFTTVPLHADAGKLFIGGTNTDAAGGAVLMCPNVTTISVWQPLKS